LPNLDPITFKLAGGLTVRPKKEQAKTDGCRTKGDRRRTGNCKPERET